MTIRKNKPLSPHITIYKPQISSILSISHRISGAFNFFGMLCLLWWIVYLAFAVHPYNECIVYQFFTSMVGKIVLIAWSFSLFLHSLTGIRHLFWDMGYGFDVKTTNTTGLLAVLGAFLLTAFTWSLATGLLEVVGIFLAFMPLPLLIGCFAVLGAFIAALIWILFFRKV